MTRTLSGLALGMIVAVTVLMSVESAGYQLFPLPVVQQVETQEPIALPPGVLAFLLLSWTLGVVAGAYVAVRVSRVGWTAWVVAGAIIAAVVLRFSLAQHPLWMMAAGVLLPLAAAWISQRLASPSIRAQKAAEKTG